MPLAIGTRLGPYEITGTLGAGGMGEVYRARDTKLNRDVALKILPDAFAGDPERLARFRREAQVLASLNHPHIGAIYGFEDGGDVHALVLELVEGDTLADRIARGPLPLDEALPIARQIAEALETAHEHGIIHRDLKPANIKVTPDGVVKVLDFGLAKLAGPAGASSHEHPGFSQSPTITSPAMITGVGVLLGTAAYMSPEQAKGREADKRSDIWAFGCALYEMLSGKRAFAGEEIADTLAQVLMREPDWTALPAGTPPPMRRLLSRCMEKDRRRRLRDIGDALNDLDDAASWRAEGTATGPAVLASAPTGWRTRTWLPWSLVAGLALALVGLASALLFRAPPVDPAVYRSTVLIDASLSRRAPSNRFTLSPDGQRLAYVASDASGRVLIWVRPLAGTAGQPLSGTDDANALFWSPDSQVIAFIANRKLKKIAAAGGAPITLSDATVLSGGQTSPGSWSRDDVIVFEGVDSAPLMRVAADGGALTQATTIAAGETQHGFPFFLPDGRHFLYTAFNENAPVGVFVGSLDSPTRVRLMPGGSNAQFADGILVFARDTTLMAQRFDPRTLTLSGEARPLADRVLTNAQAMRAGAFSLSATGSMVYQAESSLSNVRLAWRDRAGQQTAVLDDLGSSSNLSLSPDGSTAAMSRLDARTGTSDVWLVNLARGLRSRFTFDPQDEFATVWSSNGREIVFQSRRGGHFDLYRKTADNAGAQAVLFADATEKSPTSWSRDGRFILYQALGARSGLDIWVLPLVGDQKPFPFLATAFEEGSARFSPDGRWVLYQSSESNVVSDIYVAAFPGLGGKAQISLAGGLYPRWHHNGKEVFFVSPDGKMMSATITAGAGSVTVDTLRPLFDVRVPQGLQRDFYDVSPDGQRFLMVVPDEETSSTPLTLIVNWPALVKP